MARQYWISAVSRYFLALFLALFPFTAILGQNEHAQPTDPHHGEVKGHHDSTEGAPVDISKVAFEHILDSHSWHLWGEGHDAVSLSLPVILKTDNGITTFMSSAFHHDAHGKEVVEKNGERFVNYEEKIYCASP